MPIYEIAISPQRPHKQDEDISIHSVRSAEA